MALLAKFVATIAASPTVRLDVNDGALWRLQATSALDPPLPKRARVSTLLVDGATYPASAYEDRTLELQWVLRGATTNAVATQVQLLARELDRDSNILQYQVDGMTHPVYFRTRRLGMNQIGIIGDGTRVEVGATVPAEPFAYGLPQTLASVVVANNPAAATNPMHFDVSDVLGDVETPLVLRINHADVVETWGKQSVFAVRRRGTPSATPFFLQAESMTQGTNTTVQANDSAMSGAGSNFSRCTFTTATMATRLSTSAHPSSASVDARGRYRVYLRYRKGTSGDVFNVRLQWGESNQPVTNKTMELPAGVSRRYVDLGDVQIPMGVDAVTDLTGAPRSALGIYLAIQAERESGSGNLDFDVILLVPADDRLCPVAWSAVSGPTYAWLDGVADTAYATDGSGATSAAPQIIPLGGMPMVSPGVTNRIFVVQEVHPDAAQDAIGDTVTIVPSYLPRYLFVRGPST